ncbi:MAG: type transport system permease protein [Actinomycetota bacterium]|jgi:ABC transporter DrrB family efflux protein|nr:type transport system permease protein [Actinomycetota bacterium]
MSGRRTLITARRVLQQLGHDHRTVALLLIVPVALLTLLKLVWVDDAALFNSVGLPILGIFPFVTMFLATSVAVLRERQSGTLERLMALPMGKADLVLGYLLAFGLFAAVQALLSATVALTLLDLDVAGPTWAVILVAVLVGLLGTALGLALSAFARNEFQAVQFMPAVVFPQFLLCGLLAPREDMSPVLRAISDVLPLSYAVDAMGNITTQSGVSTDTWWALAIVTAFIVASVAAGALTLRRSARG